MKWIFEAIEAPALDPIAWFAASPDRERFFWSRDGVEIATRGALRAIETHGPGRFADASAAIAKLSDEIDGVPHDLPLFTGGFAFAHADAAASAWSGFPALRFVLPESGLVRRASGTLLYRIEATRPGVDARSQRAALRAGLEAAREANATPSARTDGAAARISVEPDVSDAAFRALVAAARDAVAAGVAEKLVVARSLRVLRSDPIDAPALVATLARAHPACALFAVARGDATFLGASPERLVRVRDREIQTAALAGTAPRGRSPEEDARLGAALRESKKEQEEHAIVVRAIRTALEPLCESLSVPEAPRLLRLDGIQHLETPVHGRLRSARPVLDVAGALHPTPAVAGAPRDVATAWLASHERLARGWYAGGVGWLDAAGGGDLAVALRSARVAGREARLYAGAGIVADSNPEAEAAETRIKLRALLVPLLEQ
jgi:isochorismate synthase